MRVIIGPFYRQLFPIQVTPLQKLQKGLPVTIPLLYNQSSSCFLFSLLVSRGGNKIERILMNL